MRTLRSITAWENIVSDDEADIAIVAQDLRKERTAGWLAAKVGKTVAEIQPALDNLVYQRVPPCVQREWARIHISCRYLHPAYSK
ncbi:MAG: hypothetical protein V8S72_06815 [Oscillospiraceae bacterium]